MLKKRDKYSRLRKVETKEYTELINRYKVILNKKSNIVSKISNMELVESIAELLEVIIIWKMLKSR